MIEIETNIKKNVIINIDKNDALRLIDNLISNAIKYNKPNGNINIKIDENQFVIQDSGVGIDKKDMSKITKRFKRANSSEGGFGIGLDIVNQVVKSYGYKLEIESKRDIGTKVRIIW
jgi:two-component system OmpR family sensor kinase